MVVVVGLWLCNRRRVVEVVMCGFEINKSRKSKFISSFKFVLSSSETLKRPLLVLTKVACKSEKEARNRRNTNTTIPLNAPLNIVLERVTNILIRLDWIRLDQENRHER